MTSSPCLHQELADLFRDLMLRVFVIIGDDAKFV